MDPAIELKKQWNMKGTVITIIVGTLGTVPKSLEKSLNKLEIIRRTEVIETTALLKWARILRIVMET